MARGPISLYMLVGATCLLGSSTGSRVTDNYYTPIINTKRRGLIQEFPILLDIEGQIGSTSGFGNASGILYLVTNASSVDKLKLAPASDYIALISQEMFQTHSGVLAAMHKCKGFLVFTGSAQLGVSPPAAGSPDNPVPNSRHGLKFDDLVGQKFNEEWYYTKNDGDKQGTHFSHFDKPVMFLEEEYHEIVFGAYTSMNIPDAGEEWPEYFLAGAQLSLQMDASGDAETCLRRGYCAVLGGWNTFGTVAPAAAGQKLYILSAQMDALALFHDRVHGLNADASGMIAVLAVADILHSHVLADEKNAAVLTDNNTNIMFNLFDGEAFGYIGSSAVGSKMRNNTYPNGDENATIGFADIAGYVELGQLLSADLEATPEVPLHAYTYGTSNTGSAGLVTTMQSGLGGAAKLSYATGYQVPPASLRSLLYEASFDGLAESFNATVITDFDHNGYKNKFYHSRRDDAQSNGNLTVVAAKLAVVVEGVAKGLWKQATGEDAVLPSANATLIADLLECYTVSTNCSLARELLSLPSPAPLSPINRYVGVSSSAQSRNSNFAYKALASVLSDSNTPRGDDLSYCMNGTVETNEYPFKQSIEQTGVDICMNNAYVYVHRVWSPAFVGNDLKPLCTSPEELSGNTCRDPRHSTWTESDWQTPTIALITVGSPASESVFLGVSITYALCIFGAVWLASSRFEQNLLRKRRVSLLQNDVN